MKPAPRCTGAPPHDRSHGYECGAAPLRTALTFGTVEERPAGEEVVCRYAGRERWEDVARFLELLTLLHGTVRHISPTYRFHLITGDPDDDAFADCAIVAEADYLITSDHHFAPLKGSGYKPQPITPEDFIRRFLQS